MFPDSEAERSAQSATCSCLGRSAGKLCAQDLVIHLAGAEQWKRVDAADIVEAHDAAKAVLLQQSVGLAKIQRLGGEENDASGMVGFHTFNSDARAVLGRWKAM